LADGLEPAEGLFVETVVAEEVVSIEAEAATAADDALVEEVPELDSGRPPPLIVPCN